MLIYLDTIAWNILCDSRERTAMQVLENSEVLFSSCNFDEFCLASSERAQELCAFSLETSNGRRLRDHIELSAAEIRARLTSSEPADPYEDDPKFSAVWKHASESGVPEQIRSAAQEQMEAAKRDLRDHLRTSRDVFRPLFARFEKLGVKQAWPELLNEMDAEGSLMAWVLGLIEHEGLLGSISDRDAAARIGCRSLPATACWVEYSVGMSYLASFDSGKMTKPDRGDQVDFRHAAYAGVVDVFVTADSRMQYVLNELVLDRRAEVVTPDGLGAVVQ